MNQEIHKLVGNLEAARLAELNRLAGRDLADAASDIRSLADIQTGLTAAREVLVDNAPRLGHGSETSA
jgi:hypothetical protein